MATLTRPVTVTPAILSATNAATAEPAWAIGTTYAAAALVSKNLADGTGRAWISQAAGNVGHDPLTDDGTHWKDAGPTNPWLMFGDSATRQTTHADSLAVTLALPSSERVDTLWLGNISGTSLHVVQTDADDGVVADLTFDLTSASGIMDPFAWSFEPVVRKSEILVTGLNAAYSGSTLAVTISETGATCGIGALVLGQGKSLGATQWGMSASIKDYSTFADDPFGDEAVVERPYKKLISFTSILDNAYADELAAQLAKYRATPVLIVGDGGFEISVVWGLVSFKIDVRGPAKSFCSIDVRSRAQ